MTDQPVTTSRRSPAERIMPGDSVRHVDGKRIGICEAIVDESGHRIVHWDDGSRETLLCGFLERIPPTAGPDIAATPSDLPEPG